MNLKDIKDKLMLGGTVTIATLGCSSCGDNGAVDPPPPPLRCSDVSAGQTLSTVALLADTIITVSITSSYAYNATWKDVPQITNPVGFTVEDVALPSSQLVTVELKLGSLSVTSGEFTFEGVLVDMHANQCQVTRTFTVTIDNGQVQVTQHHSKLPLGVRGAATIQLVRRDGLNVELKADLPEHGGTVSWSVTDGSFERRGDDRLVWRLPSRSGLYQVELVTDHGRAGLALDTLILEVS